MYAMHSNNWGTKRIPKMFSNKSAHKLGIILKLFKQDKYPAFWYG